ncbi:serine hydrolase domain-containing protein [Telluribacter humicola]|uniref:serine hydrolase domain-containing protein n=1 Tax=Telluribacter humicola TaxID=1720261 RepID=UPI001A964692|nr:serine hydrolase domain-containing protein [Telluribacter humicola]
MHATSTRVFLILLFLGTLVGSCVVEPTPVEELTLADSTRVSQRLDISATASTTLTDDGPWQIKRYGHVWSEQNPEPTINDARSEYSKAITALPFTFNSPITNLTANKTYYIRAYVENAENIAYGPVSTFTTQPGLALRLAATLDDSLKDRDFGYSYAIFEKGEMVTSGGGGFQSRSVESAGAIPFTVDTKMHVASMTKTLTAMAFLKLATEKGIKPTDYIIDYLPSAWHRGTNIDKITFHDLLTHRSGIVGFQNNCRNGAYTENYWYGLKALIAKGVQPQHLGNYCYQNVNFGLYRVLIPAMMGYQFTGNDQTDDTRTQQLYEDYLRKNIIEKAGVTTTLLLNTYTQNPTYGYDYPFSGSRGFIPGNFASTAGAYGFYLSAREAATVYAKILSTPDESALTTALKDALLTKGYGAYSTQTPDGRFSYHDGWWYILTGNSKAQGFRSVWLKAPNDITIVLLTNGLREGDNLFPLKSSRYLDITSFVLWAHSQAKRITPLARENYETNFHDYLQYPEPH